jgi:hypothetical protein
MPLKQVILEIAKIEGTLPFFQAKIRFSGITGAFCHKDKFIFLNSTQRDGSFDTRHDLF